ncbi:MAG: helix-turn-helix transcriptional regulator [Verrucomicrobia bacterium]|nr:helix-turn-helix transcriptional regulator [Verrucomicrobiota bacterium]
MTKSKITPKSSSSPLDLTWYGKRFAPDFVYDRPFGAGDDMIHFFHFRNEVVLRDDEGDLPRNSGVAILYPPDTPHRFQGVDASEKPLLCDHVALPIGVMDRLLKHGVPLNHAFAVTNPQPVMDTVLSLRTEERKAQAHWKTASRAYQTVLILQLAREAEKGLAASRSERDERTEQVIHDVCAMIDRNPAHPWVVAELAQTVGMSRGRFTALFTQVAGVSPQEYAINARIREVCVLLTNTSLTVTQIADRCGFSSAYYLSRLFSSRIGCPPSRYADRFQVAAE